MSEGSDAEHDEIANLVEDEPLQIDLSNNSDDEEDYSTAELIKVMEDAWHNEKFAPEILPHNNHVVTVILDLISAMEDNLAGLTENDFLKGFHQMELLRLKYLINSYLRNRLEKIEMHAFVILQEEEARSERGEELYLTEGEMQFAKEYKESIDQYFDKVLAFWPGLPMDDWKKEKIGPNLNTFVFLKSNKDISGVMLDDVNDGDIIDFKENSQILISYANIAHYVKKGEVGLI